MLQNIFQDNKNQRAVYFENQLTSDNFPNVSSYCQELKMIADQLANVGAPVSNQRLVLQLITGLNNNYDVVATLIPLSDPLPEFYEARSKLCLEESRKTNRAFAAANAAATALVSEEPRPKPPLQTRPATTIIRQQMVGVEDLLIPAA